METEKGELFVVHVVLRGLPLHLAEASELTAPDRSPKERVSSHFADECVHQDFRTVFPIAWSTGYGWAAAETSARAGDVLQICPALKPRPVHIRTKGEVGKGNVDFSLPSLWP